MGKKRKNYFNNDSTKKTKFMFDKSVKLAPNMKGFMISYNCKFTFCLNEAKKLIQQFAGEENVSNEKDKQPQVEKSDDIEKLLKQELDGLNKRDKQFSILDTGAKHTIFISLDDANPNQVVESIFDYIANTKKPVGRFVQRLVPVINTCKAYAEDIEKCLKVTLDELDAIKASDSSSNGDENAKAFKYCCVFKTSNNNNLSRDTIFKLVGSYMQSKNKSIKVDFDQPDYVLVIHVICNLAYVSFLRNYFDYRKYNLVEMGAKFISTGSKSANADTKLEPVKEKSATVNDDSDTENDQNDDDNHDKNDQPNEDKN